MTVRLTYFLSFCCLTLLSTAIRAEVGPDKQYYLVKDFRNDWLVYDQGLKNYVPFVSDLHATQAAVNLIIDIESNRRYELMIYTEKDNYIFLNASLRERLRGGTWRVFKLDSLYRLYRKPQVLLTLYGTAGILDKQVLIGHRKTSTEKLINVEEESFLSLRPRERSVFDNFFTLGVLFISVFAASLNNGYPRAFQRFYSPYDLIMLDAREETFLVNKPFSRASLLFIVLLSLLLTFLFFFVNSKEYNLFASKQLITVEQTSFQRLLLFVEITLVAFLALIGKYAMLYLLGQLYGLEKITNLHFFKDIQASVLFYSGLTLLVALLSFYIRDWAPYLKSLVIVPCVVFYIARTVLLYLTINNNSDTKNLYLISYLCIAELIPLIIGIRYAF